MRRRGLQVLGLSICLLGLVSLFGCIPGLGPTIVTFEANPDTGVPVLSAGGLEVTFVSSGTFGLIDYGDGESGYEKMHVYKRVGNYTATTNVLQDGKTYPKSVKITVWNDPDSLTVYPPFIAGSYPEEFSHMIVDGRGQLHGCIGENSGFYYGAYPRSGETFIYNWVITVEWSSGDRLVVFGKGTEEFPLETIRWHVASPLKTWPDWYPVPTIYGIDLPDEWLEAAGDNAIDQQSPCYDPDNPWIGYPGTPVTARGTIQMTVFNQMGVWKQTKNVVNIHVSQSCGGPPGQPGGCEELNERACL